MEPSQAPGPGEDLTTHLDLPRGAHLPSPHPWYAVRDEALALLTVTLALDPNALVIPRLLKMAGELDYAGVRNALEDNLGAARPPATIVYDFCSGTGTLAGAAAALGCKASAVELEPVAALISRVINTYSAEPSIARADLPTSWTGLGNEISKATTRFLANAISALHDSCEIALTSRSLLGRLWARCHRCRHCGQYIPVVTDARIADDLVLKVVVGDDSIPVPQLVHSAEPDSYRTWSKGQIICVRCNVNERVRPREIPFAAPLVDLFVDAQGKLQPSPAVVELLDFNQRLEVDPTSSPITSLDDPRSIWGWQRGQSDPIYVGTACLPSHQRFLSTAVLQVKRDYKENFAELPENRRDALACSLALVLSALMPDLSTFARWDPRSKRPRRGPRLPHWVELSPFFEAGVMTIERWCHDTATRLGTRIDSAASKLRRPVSIRVADAAVTGLPERSADVVVWDPLVYDDVDYQALARPHDLMLASLSEILPADIEINVLRRFESAQHYVPFDKSEYEAQITAQAEEVV